MSTQSEMSTRGPRGIRFKSRVEAHWAYIFDEFGWSWEYQPVNLNGYIPDFIITFAAAQVLVKVKETSNIWEDPQQEQYIDEIKKSEWAGYYFIIGNNYKEGTYEYWMNIGLLGKIDGSVELDDVVIRKTKTFWHLGGDSLGYDIGLYPVGMNYSDDVRFGDNAYHWKNCDDDAAEMFGNVWFIAETLVKYRK